MTNDEVQALVREAHTLATSSTVMDSLVQRMSTMLTALSAEVQRLSVDGIHTCHDQCTRTACVLRRERDEARAEVERWKEAYRKEFLSAIDWAGKTQEMEHERDQARDDLAEAERVIRIFSPSVARAFLAKHA